MKKDKPSRTAYKVALNSVILGAKPGMDKFLPPALCRLWRNCWLLPARWDQELFDGLVAGE